MFKNKWDFLDGGKSGVNVRSQTEHAVTLQRPFDLSVLCREKKYIIVAMFFNYKHMNVFVCVHTVIFMMCKCVLNSCENQLL